MKNEIITDWMHIPQEQFKSLFPKTYKKIKKIAVPPLKKRIVYVQIMEGGSPPLFTEEPAFWQKGNSIWQNPYPPCYPGYQYHRVQHHIKMGREWLFENMEKQDKINYVVLQLTQQ